MKLIILFSSLFTMNVFAMTLKTVDYVDPTSYMGTWYEIAKLPNSFQKNCAQTKAQYSLRSDGKVNVKNTCFNIKKDKFQVAKGIAKIKDTETNAKLGVSFIPLLKYVGPYNGKYWILDLDANYEYVLVGEPSREYLWILSRTPELDQEIVDGLLNKAKSLGFDINKVKFTKTWEFALN